MKFNLPLAVASVCLLATAAHGQTSADRPWLNPDVAIVIDPYEANSIDWTKLVTDTRVKAVIHKASQGLQADAKFKPRYEEARQAGLYYGAYHLGKPGNPIGQADFLLEQVKGTDVKFLALDIEDNDPSRFMSLEDSVLFIDRIHEETGRYPAVYVNYNVYKIISQKYGTDSVFAKTPLWIARFRNTHGMQTFKVWPDYTLWQFSSEINCKPNTTCLYSVPGTKADMDINVFNGTPEALKALFE